MKQLKEQLEAAEAKAVALQEARAAQAAAERDLQVRNAGGETNRGVQLPQRRF